MDNDSIQAIKDYISDNNLELDQIDLIFNTEDIELPDVKVNLVFLSEVYVKYFNSFCRCLADYNNEFTRVVINDKEVLNNIIRKSNYKTNNFEFGKNRAIALLEDYVLSKYSYIIDFIDLYKEISD